MVLISNCPQLNNPCNGWNPTPPRCWYGTDPLAALAFAGLSAVRRSRRPPEPHADAPPLSAGSPGTTSGRRIIAGRPASL